LRERLEDIRVFANFFLTNVNSELAKDIRGITPEVEKVFVEYSWPGNLREMNNVIRRAALLAESNMITVESLPEEMALYPDSLRDVENQQVYHNGENLKTTALQAEYHTILRVLQQVNFNKSKAALLLNIDRKTLYSNNKSALPRDNCLHTMQLIFRGADTVLADDLPGIFFVIRSWFIFAEIR